MASIARQIDAIGRIDIFHISGGTGATLASHSDLVPPDTFAEGCYLSAIPVLAATSAYVIGQEFGFRSSLSGSVWHERRFYEALAGALLVGVIISFAGISPIHLLFISSIVGGLGTPISMVFLLLIGQNR